MLLLIRAVLGLSLASLLAGAAHQDIAPARVAAADRAAWLELERTGHVLFVGGQRELPRGEEAFDLQLGGHGQFHLDSRDATAECETFDGRFLRRRTWRGAELFVDPASGHAHARLAALLTGKWIDAFEEDEAGARTTLLGGDGIGELRYELSFGANGRLASARCADGRETLRFESWKRRNDFWMPERIVIESRRADQAAEILMLEAWVTKPRTSAAFDVSPRGSLNVTFDKPVTVERAPGMGKTPAVTATVGGEPFWFFVDTSRAMSIVDRDVLDAGESEVVGRDWIETPAGRKSVPLMRLAKLEVGGLTWTGVHAVELDFQDYTRALGHRVGGILGMDFLLRCNLHINGSEITVLPADRRPTVLPASDAELGAQGWTTLDVVFDGTLPLVDASVAVGEQVHDGRFLFDTSEASNALLYPKVWRRLFSAELEEGARTARPSWLELGVLRLAEPGVRLALADEIDPALETLAPVWSGAVGMDLLEHEELLLDFPHGRVFTRPLPATVAEAAR